MPDRMLAGDLYIADDPRLAADNLRAMRLMEQFNRSPADAPEDRQRLLRELLGTLGERASGPATITAGGLLIEGLVGIAAGVATFAWPGLTALVLVYIIAIRAVVTGVFEVIAAIRLRQVIRNEWLLVLSGIVSMLFGIALVVVPGAGALALVWRIAALAIVDGILLLLLSFRLRGLGHEQLSPLPA
jgi:uncharacterized membrane protein HdeD (DUF308 family)